MTTKPDQSSINPFKSAFKYYKRRQPPPDYSNVIQFSCNNPKNLTKFGFKQIHVTLSDSNYYIYPGLNAPIKWLCYTSDYRPGMFLLSNIFNNFESELQFCRELLLDAPSDPLNVTNLDAFMSNIDRVNLYNNKWTSFIQQLRWTTLGYHYNWTDKVYMDDKRHVMPNTVAHITEHIAKVLGFSTFKAETAIINYYNESSTLSGHTDHSEDRQDQPLFSYSFGQNGIFLAGGLTQQEEPLAFMLSSGDCLVLSGQQRLIYHAVPKVCSGYVFELNPCYGEQHKTVVHYLNNHRINLSVRQVK